MRAPLQRHPERLKAPEPATTPARRAILRPGETCWRIVRTERAAFLVDAMAYFQAAKAAIHQARRSILILGWDFEPRIRLEPHRDDATEPDVLGDLLEQLVAERPDLHVGVLRWDMPFVITVGQHPKMPLRLRNWMTRDRLQLRLDSSHPPGAAHHQKLLVIDDTLAFCGGIDLAGDRWDRPGHPDAEPLRQTPDGFGYVPHHDVMMAVSGPAAAALGELARRRWRHATGEAFSGGAADGPLWPEGLEADLTDIDIGIARTEPRWYTRPPVRENEALFLRSIAAARDSIYLESQYLTTRSVAEALERRLAERDGPDVVIVIPHQSPGWFDRLAMDSAREAVIRRLRAADIHGRLRIYAPYTAGGEPIVIHSKITVIDERFLRVGTANLNNRSMGFDTECDLALEDGSAGRQACQVRPAARRLRDGLLAEHLGVGRQILAEAIASAGGLAAGIEAVRRGGAAGRLRPVSSETAGLDLPLSGPNPFDPADPEDVFWLGGVGANFRPHVPLALVFGVAGLAAAGWLASRWLTRKQRDRAGW